MSSPSELISARREDVLQSYNSARATNRRLFLEGDDKATDEYIFPNQMEDANNIVNKFYKNKRRVISIQKKTKVGADGLMIEIAKLLTTHIDDSFVVNPANVRILTGMSNAGWEKDMIDKAPTCFKDKIFHHRQLSRADLQGIHNSVIIIDEIDTGDKECQVLHNTLKEAGVLDVKHMEDHNNRFVFISATMIKELYDLYPWGDLHELYKMTIPSSYIGHKDFLEKGIIKEFYSLSSEENATKWVQDDIVTNYRDDYRVHLVRVNTKTVHVVQNACIRNGVTFRNHTSTDRLSEDDIKEFFKEPLTQHIVLGIKGFFRRANLIPNRWKLRIGATHELHTKVVDNNVQIQGLPGRMTGYWRGDIEGGHKTGPHRTSIKAIEEYEKIYLDPFGSNSYQTAGFKKKKGKVSADSTMLSPKNIPNLNATELPVANQEFTGGIEFFKHSDGFEASDKYIQDTLKGISVSIEKLKTSYYFGKGVHKENEFYKCALFGKKSEIHTLEELRSTKPWITKNVEASFGRTIVDAREKTGWAIHLYYGYEDTDDTTSLWYGVRWIRKQTIPESKVSNDEEHKEDVWSNSSVLTNEVVEHPIAAQPASSDSATPIQKNKPKKGPKIAPK